MEVVGVDGGYPFYDSVILDYSRNTGMMTETDKPFILD
jgi:hypothetical protein